jgi:hypothetical protein
MTMTSSESQWIARVMHTISYVAFIESCNSVVRIGQKGAGEEVLGVARNFIAPSKRDGNSGTNKPLAASLSPVR